jgi:prepilin-type N-terminal cleavage/methylation domain-containing protein
VRGTQAGFSLVEVIIAVGIFAVAVVAVLGLLPILARSAAESADALVAQRLPAALESELRKSASASSLDALASSIPTATTLLENGAAFIASRDGLRLAPIGESTNLIMAGDGYFVIEVWRFPSEPLAFVPGGAVLAIRARVSWPYRLAGSATATPFNDRSQLSFNLAINR